MSLYYEAEAALVNKDKAGGSLKSRVFKNKDGKHPPAQIYALVSEATKWSPVLKVVIEKSELLKAERKLTATLAVLLVHDLILSKTGIAAPASHVLHLAISRHRSRLQAEFTKLRVRQGFASIDAMRESIEQQKDRPDTADNARTPHPRWVRINTLKTTLELQLSSTFEDYKRLSSLIDVLKCRREDKVYHVDQNIPDLIALPPNHDLSKSSAYRMGQIIFQDKASCIPAVLLDPAAFPAGDIIDACSAPGNKTTHLVALVAACNDKGTDRLIFAVERDASRSEIMRKMVQQAGAGTHVEILDSTDFLTLSPGDDRLKNTSSVLLDPSCSGSGIVGRDDMPTLELPALPVTSGQSFNNDKTKKRKYRQLEASAKEGVMLQESSELIDDSLAADERLESLSKFQLKLLLHAMTFPAAQRIVYSTCSIHAQENENVVVQALRSREAISHGWTILSREQQVPGLRTWEVRGDQAACEALLRSERHTMCDFDPIELAEACIRCEKGTSKGTMGFFAFGFVKSAQSHDSQGGMEESKVEEEWEGFED